jgi:hypothetical protein
VVGLLCLRGGRARPSGWSSSQLLLVEVPTGSTPRAQNAAIISRYHRWSRRCQSDSQISRTPSELILRPNGGCDSATQPNEDVLTQRPSSGFVVAGFANPRTLQMSAETQAVLARANRRLRSRSRCPGLVGQTPRGLTCVEQNRPPAQQVWRTSRSHPWTVGFQPWGKAGGAPSWRSSQAGAVSRLARVCSTGPDPNPRDTPSTSSKGSKRLVRLVPLSSRLLQLLHRVGE